MSYKHTLFDMNKTLDFIAPDGVCVEIGVWKGDFSEIISQENINSLHLVDPWKSITDIPARWHAAPQEEMDSIYESVVAKFLGNEKITIHRKFSTEAATDFENQSVDWVYIDGNHSYEFVKADLEIWWPKLKAGGAICGDDYQEGRFQVEELDFGVVKAVDEFRANYSGEIDFFRLFKDQFVLVKK